MTAGVVLLALALLQAPDPGLPLALLSQHELLAVSGIVVLLILIGIAKSHYGSLWHAFSNAAAEEKQHLVLRPWVIDGDTIDDLESGVRYRLANIDAPETGDNAKCFRERSRGELATRIAIHLVRRAGTVTVRRTWRKDRYGRRIAFVLIDGVDLGETLIKRGVAHRWRGRRKRWCGPNGGLAEIAKDRGAPFDCATCRAWNRG